MDCSHSLEHCSHKSLCESLFMSLKSPFECQFLGSPYLKKGLLLISPWSLSASFPSFIFIVLPIIWNNDLVIGLFILSHQCNASSTGVGFLPFLFINIPPHLEQYLAHFRSWINVRWMTQWTVSRKQHGERTFLTGHHQGNRLPYRTGPQHCPTADSVGQWIPQRASKKDSL